MTDLFLFYNCICHQLETRLLQSLGEVCILFSRNVQHGKLGCPQNTKGSSHGLSVQSCLELMQMEWKHLQPKRSNSGVCLRGQGDIESYCDVVTVMIMRLG